MFIVVLIICTACIGFQINASQAVHAQEMYSSVSYDSPQGTFAAVEVMTETPSTATGVEILASGEWRNGCVPQYDHTVIDGYTVRVYAVAEQLEIVCGQVLSDWSFTTTLDVEAPGLYTVDVFVTTEWHNETFLHTSTSVIVDGAIHLVAAASGSSDSASFMVDGYNYDACVPSYESHVIEENMITIEAAKPSAEFVCGQDMTPWSFEVAMGTLAPGEYEIEVYVTSFINDTAERALYKRSTLTVDPGGTKRIGPSPQPPASPTMAYTMYIPTIIAE